MHSVTLADIRSAVESKYQSFEVLLGDGKTYVAKNPLRLTKEKRDELVQVGDRLKDEDSDQVQVIADVLVSVAESPAAGKALVKEIDGDFAVLMSVFEDYMKTTQAGEASASDD